MTITRTLASVLSASLGLLLGLSPAIAGGGGQGPVETFTATWVASTVLPGHANSGGGIDFVSSERLTSIQFQPGGTMFNGAMVDFSGTEGAFLSATSSTHWSSDVGAQPLTAAKPVACSANVAVTGPLDSIGVGSGTGLTALPGFNTMHLKFAVNGDAVNENLLFSNWQSVAVPALNGASVNVRTSSTLDSIDVVSGVAEGHSSGAIYAVAAAPPGPQVMRAPAAKRSDWVGLCALFAGLTGSFLTVRSRRDRNPQFPA